MHQPTWIKFVRSLKNHDVFVHFGVSLRKIYPWFFVRRPWVATHHSHYFINRIGARDWRERLKLRLARYAAANIAISEAVADAIGIPCTIIPNPYDDALFCRDETVPRNRELVFVGRLVSDKGADILLAALGELHKQGLHPKLTIVGDGPERAALEEQAKSLKSNEQVFFASAQSPPKVAELLRGHEILVVPSVFEEPFGVVALEGAGCGCVVLGSDGGGLPGAIGPSGLTFQRGNVADLTGKLMQLLQAREDWRRYHDAAPGHLAKHQPREIAARYLEVIRQTKKDSRGSPKT